MSRITFAAYRLQQQRERKFAMSKPDLRNAAQVQPRLSLRLILRRRKEERQQREDLAKRFAAAFAAQEQIRQAINAQREELGIGAPQEVRH